MLGIDFGTTRTVVALSDKGNYPIVSFETPDGDIKEWIPSLIAVHKTTKEVRYGFDAEALLLSPEWQMISLAKRSLVSYDLTAINLITGYLGYVFTQLQENSNAKQHSRLNQVAIAVPANANTNQRFATQQAFEAAGFEVIQMLEEPSAAALEYVWRRPEDSGVKNRHLAIYDLGGGTFDVAVISLEQGIHRVLATEGIQGLGGEDFDMLLAELFFEQGASRAPTLGFRDLKEQLTPYTKKINYSQSDGQTFQLPIERYREACAPLVEGSATILKVAIEKAERSENYEFSKNTVIYQVGGGSQLVFVRQMLKQLYGKRVWRSPYPHGSIAIGLAIAGDQNTEIASLTTRYFGVWREADAGESITFDVVFSKGSNEQHITRRYQAAHTLAHYRFVECTLLNHDGSPAGDVSFWGEAELIIEAGHESIQRLNRPGPIIEEHYAYGDDGGIHVTIINTATGERIQPSSAQA